MEFTKKCLNKGKPVFMEKPAGLSSQDSKELYQLAISNNTFGVVGYNRRCFSLIQNGLAYLSSMGPIRGGILEVPEMISIQKRKNKHPKEIYDNWLFAQTSHAIDLFNYILGDFQKVKSLGSLDFENNYSNISFSTSIKFSNNILGSLIGLWDSQAGYKMTIIAEKGRLEFSPLAVSSTSGIITTRQGRRIQIHMDDVDHKYRPGIYMQDKLFLDSVQYNRFPSPPICTLSDAVKTNFLIEEIVKTA